MGIRIPVSELAEKTGGTFASFVYVVVPPLRDFSCDLWFSFPDQITKGSNPFTALSRGFMNELCKDKNLPPAPPDYFEGGQCNVQYKIIGSCQAEQYSAGTTGNNPTKIQDVFPGVNTTSLSPPIVGPIESLRFYTSGPCAQPSTGGDRCDLGNRQVSLEVIDSEGTKNYLTTLYTVKRFGPGSTTIGGQGYVDTNTLAGPEYTIETVSGDPDICGDRPGPYPPTNPTPEDYTRDIPIPTPDGGTLLIPTIYAPVDFNFPMRFDVGGVNVTLDLGGFDFEFGGDVNDNGVTLDDNGYNHPLPYPEDVSRQPVVCPVDPTPGDPELEEEEKTPEDPKEVDQISRLKYVKVAVTEFPTNAKNQWGDGAPNVYYCGWFEFRANGASLPRQPIHFLSSIFKAPEGVDGYAYTLYQGFVGSATEYREKEDI